MLWQSQVGNWVLPIGPCSQPVVALALPRRPPFLSSSFYSLFIQTRASSHERTTTAISSCLYSSTLDRSCVPREDTSETREISTGWLAAAEPQT